MLAEDSIRVSWDRVQDDLVTHYIVYYSQTDRPSSENIRIVPSADNFVEIVNLAHGSAYRFEVVAQVILGEVLQSDRSPTINFNLQQSTSEVTSSTQVTCSSTSPTTSSATSSNVTGK